MKYYLAVLHLASSHANEEVISKQFLKKQRLMNSNPHKQLLFRLISLRIISGGSFGSSPLVETDTAYWGIVKSPPIK